MRSMGIFYIVLLAVVVLFYVATKNYKKDITDGSRKKYKYRFLCGMSMYIVDKLRKTRHFCGKNKISAKLKQLCVKDIVESEVYVYTVDKISLSIVIFSVILIFGAAFTLKGDGKPESITELDRPDYGEVPKEYLLEAENGDERETVHLVVKEREYKKEEIMKTLEESYDSVIRFMLDKNQSLSDISSNLIFASEYGKEGISLSWGTSRPDVIGYDGRVYGIGEDTDVTIYLTMSFGGVAKTYDIAATVTAKQGATIGKRVQDAIDSYDSYKDKVVLPDNLDGDAMHYLRITKQVKIPFIVAAFMISCFIFFMKDKDMDKALEDRSKQLQSDYSEIVSKLMLLHSAGLNIRMAWKRILADYDRHGSKNFRYAYEEMRLAENKMESGCPEKEAYNEFGKRCGLHNYIKLGNILGQNLVKGTKGMKELLEYEVHEAFEERKKSAIKRGDEAGTKMLIPMVIMLVISIVIVVVPSFLKMGMF